MEYLDISFSFTIYKFLKLKHSSTTYSDLKIIRNPCQCVYVIESRIAIRIACESFKLNTRTEGQGLFFWCFWLSLHMVHSTGRIKRVQASVACAGVQLVMLLPVRIKSFISGDHHPHVPGIWCCKNSFLKIVVRNLE